LAFDPRRHMIHPAGCGTTLLREWLDRIATAG
jgi:hypothetical protein